jgi:hypothetical protein
MRPEGTVLAAVALGMSLTSAVSGADRIEINVRIVSKDVPVQVTVQNENDIQPADLSRDRVDGTFKITLPRPSARELEQAKLLVAPYRLVASWGEAKEQVFLGLRSTAPKDLNLRVYHETLEYDDSALSAIEALGTDFESVQQRYFRSRAFHRYWRYKNRMPEHAASLRSARLWFDAAVRLVKWPNSVFRMDDEIKKVMEDYEDRAKSDPSFSPRYRRYTSPGYVRGTLEQVLVVDYAFVGDIPKLVKDGQFGEAGELNRRALTVLSNESSEVQRIVMQLQRINVDLLMQNAAYISTRQGVASR